MKTSNLKAALLLVGAIVIGGTGVCAHAQETPQVLDIYLMRHGQTQWNLDKRLQGGTDNPLNETGQKQAADLAKQLAGVRFDQVYTSALQRARTTAEAVAGGTAITVLPALSERSFGKFEGIYEDDRDAVRFAEFKQRGNQLDDGLDGGESLGSQAARVKKAVQEIVARHQKGAVAIVAHGGVNPLVLAALLDLPVAEAVERIKQGNDELYLVRLRAQQQPSVWKYVTRSTLEQL